MIRSFLYLPDSGVKIHQGIGDFDSWCARDDALLWVDMCKPTDEESFVLTNDFQFHPPRRGHKFHQIPAVRF